MTDPIVSVPVSDLLRVLPFKAGDEQVRFYLHGVLVVPHEDHALLVATNGHWLAVYESADARTDKERILHLPDQFVRHLHGLDDDGREYVDEDGESLPRPIIKRQLTVATEKSHIIISEVGMESLIKPGAAFVEGTFPDWRKVLPDPTTLEAGLFDPFAASYLGSLHKAVPDEHGHALFCYHSRAKKTPAVFRFGDMPEFVALLMPRSDGDKEVTAWPKWMAKEPQS